MRPTYVTLVQVRDRQARDVADAAKSAVRDMFKAVGLWHPGDPADTLVYATGKRVFSDDEAVIADGIIAKAIELAGRHTVQTIADELFDDGRPAFHSTNDDEADR